MFDMLLKEVREGKLSNRKKTEVKIMQSYVMCMSGNHFESREKID